MTPVDVESFCDRLKNSGLVFIKDNKAIDFAVVDHIRGPTNDCDWLEFGHLEIDGNRVAACRTVGSTDREILTPDGWHYEESLSRSYGFVPTGSEEKSLVFLRRDKDMDVFLNRLTGKEVYMGRTEKVSAVGRNAGGNKDKA